MWHTFLASSPALQKTNECVQTRAKTICNWPQGHLPKYASSWWERVNESLHATRAQEGKIDGERNYWGMLYCNKKGTVVCKLSLTDSLTDCLLLAVSWYIWMGVPTAKSSLTVCLHLLAFSQALSFLRGGRGFKGRACRAMLRLHIFSFMFFILLRSVVVLSSPVRYLLSRCCAFNVVCWL